MQLDTPGVNHCRRRRDAHMPSRFHTKVMTMEPGKAAGWDLVLESPDGTRTEHFDRVVLAVGVSPILPRMRLQLRMSADAACAVPGQAASPTGHK
jgi:hypothetical protein